MENGRIRGIIFDLDGVLVSTDRLHFLAWKRIADRLGCPFDERLNDSLRGVSRTESLRIILRAGGVTLTEGELYELAEEKNRIYREYLSGMTPSDVAADVRATLAKLRGRGYRLAVGSSSKNAGYILERTELRSAFDAVVDGWDISETKPDPEVFLLAAERLALPPAECAVIEDAAAGILAARRAGMFPVGIGPAAADPGCGGRIGNITELLNFFN